MQVIDGIPVFGIPEQEAAAQMSAAMSCGGYRCALMADHHIGYSVPVGGVIAYEGKVCVNGVGYDIACGNKAVRLDCDSEALKGNIYRTMNEIQSKISFGIGRKNKETVDDALFSEPLWEEIPILSKLKDSAVAQLGTVGAGNHYVDLFIDENKSIWCGVHFGSRGLGHSIASHFVKEGGGVDGVHAKPVLFEENSDLGQQYLACMDLAGRYAYAGRNWVCEKVAKILRAGIVEEVHNHHNFAWKENHFGKNLWVVRKGATPCWPGQQCFVGGSMGDLSYILEGVEGELSPVTLYSTVHGAGRAMGRKEAKGVWKKGVCVREGRIKREAMDSWVKGTMGVELRGGDVDEAPQAYKRIDEVLESHKATVKILHTLRPLGVCMADGRDYDPYKD